MTAARTLSFLGFLILSGTSSIHAQDFEHRFEASVGYSLLRADFLAGEPSTESGILGRLGYNLHDSLSVEGEISLFPQGLGVPSRGFVTGFFGARYGPQFQHIGVFGKVRPGFVRFQEPAEPFACIAVFPPPLACVIGGRTEFALDAGGVVELYARRLTFRVDAGDAMIRFREPGRFWTHNFMFASSVGFRF